jgi:predicted nucleotidyltransferase
VISFEPVLRALTENNVEFVVIGGLAITAYGSAYVTNDLDFCYARNKTNYENIVAALSTFNPGLRGAPEGLPFFWDAETLKAGNNFTLKTDVGDVDMLGEVSGVGAYQQVSENCVEMELMGYKVKIISIEALIKAKRAAGRTKDLLVLPELEALLELQTDEED